MLRSKSQTVLVIRTQEDCRALFHLLKCVIGTPAQDHTGFFSGDFLDRLKLSQEDLLIDRHFAVGIAGIIK